MSTSTGLEEFVTIGERIASLRQAYTVRETGRTRKRFVHGRMIGNQPIAYGPTEGISVDLETQVDDLLDASGWDRETTKPKRAKLMELGLDDVAEDLWSGE